MRQVGGWKFRRQHPIGPYFVDFYCPAARLVVQIVSATPEASPPWADDHARTVALAAGGYRVVEVHAEDVEADTDGVVDAINRELRAMGISTTGRSIGKARGPNRLVRSALGEPYERQGYGRRQ